MKSIRILATLSLGFFIQTLLFASDKCPLPKPTAACASAVCTSDSTGWEWTPKNGTPCKDVIGNQSSCDGNDYVVNGREYTCPLGCPKVAEVRAIRRNPYMPQFDHPYRHGVVPTLAAHTKIKAWEKKARAGRDATSDRPNACEEVLSFGGGIDGIGVTSGAPRVYLVIYGSQWGTTSTDANGNMTFTGDSMGELPRLQSLFKGLGTGGERWSNTMTQYCDGPGVSSDATNCPANAAHVAYPTLTVLAGIWYDNSTASPGSATGNQLGSEAVKAAAHFGNTTAGSNRYAQYVILSPPGTNPDGFNTPSGAFCAWHSYNGDTTLSGGAAPSDYGDIAFTNMPYVTDAGKGCGRNFVNGGSAGLLDGVTIIEGHEYAETVTDQNPLGGWTNRTGYDKYVGGDENGDECAWIQSGQGASANVTMGNGSYPMQSTWSNATARCEISYVGPQQPPPPCVDVPDVTEGFPDKAQAVLAQAGFAVTFDYPGEWPKGQLTGLYVLRQSPAPDSCKTRGSTVTLVLRKKPVQ